MTFHVRSANDDDVDAISILLSSVYDDRHPAILARDLRAGRHFHREIVAERDGVVLGYVALVTLAAPPNWVALSLLSVSHSVQDQGVGRQLVVAAQDEARFSKRDAIVAVGGEDYLRRCRFAPKAAANLRTEFPPNIVSLYPVKPETALSHAVIKFPEPFSRSSS
ncbi:MAG: GNAT family N-acetyltransferase [Pseudomonadota bacterium]